MADKKTNADAVKDYHKKLVNLAVVRVPSEEVSGIDFKAEVTKYLCDRYGEKKDGVPNKSMNEYILDLINVDLQKWYGASGKAASENQPHEKRNVVLVKGVKDLK